ncbi:Ankyrin repeat-containing protein [Cynara cardunculus var. scolymus]|uniref:Ankyrin repeat-containing protein n=1 Tax=Cynara cardunculus var. scolymus TaxID=59895 RepID=A0A103XJM6_CYNCS|nr:Ankyrin repeat-containing protein [Cynara cardunculus var. scolymus]
MKGNWKAAKDIFEKHEELVRFSINRNCETTLHVAAYEGNTLFVKNLVTLMENKDMELQNSSSNTALCLAAVAGHVEMAEIMVTKNKTLLDIAGSEGKMPLYMAALSGRHDMVKYLYENSERMTGGFWTHESRGCVLLSCVEAELFANKYKRLIDEENQALKLLRIIWAHIVKLPKAKIDDILRGPADPIMEDDKLTQKYSSRILFVAAGMGNTAFIVELIRQYPERVLELDDNNQTIFHVAISHRHFSIYSLLYEIGSIKDSVINLEDGKGNNMLHLVGILEETTMIMSNQLQNISGAVLQMRQELVWFELHLSEVKAILPPSLREKKNTAGLSPHELFTENHKGLVSKGEEWIKKHLLN